MAEKNIAIILAREQSTRAPGKCFEMIEGKPLFYYVHQIAEASGVCDAIVVSTEHDSAIASYADKAGLEVVRREAWWDDKHLFRVAELSLEQYEEGSGTRYDYATILYGTAIFWRPSWIRVALNTLKQVRVWGNEQVGMIYGDAGCFIMRLNRMAAPNFRFRDFPHRGINIDIDTPSDVIVARQVMEQILAGNIDYPLDENAHDDSSILDHWATKTRESVPHKASWPKTPGAISVDGRISRDRKQRYSPSGGTIISGVQ